MKIVMSAVLLDEKCQPLMIEGKLYTLGVLCSSLLIGGEWEKENAEEKGKRFDLWMKVRGKDEVDLSSTEVAQLQGLVGRFAATLIVGQARELLEGRPNPLEMDRVAIGRE